MALKTQKYRPIYLFGRDQESVSGIYGPKACVKNRIKPMVFALSGLLSALSMSCNGPSEDSNAGRSKFMNYCGNCHVLPEPGHIPKAIWKNEVLPEMAARLGFTYTDYNPLAKLSMKERLYIGLSKVYPKESTLDSASWWQIHEYIMALAPDSVPVDTLRKNRHSPLTQFKKIPISLNETYRPAITSIRFNADEHEFTIGDAYGKVYTWPGTLPLEHQFRSPIMSYLPVADQLFVTEVGYMRPSEQAYGSLHRITSQSWDTLAIQLHRPVHTEVNDIDNDGVPELLICEFGHHTGQLSLGVPSRSGVSKKALLPMPGTIKVEIADMDTDGKKDIVVLASQGNEGVYILYGKGELQFSTDQVIRMGPEYGSSWFELIDYNKDGHLDIILANGDNADYSVFPKPYHGVRLFVNDGKNNFEEKWFYPIYGATRVLSEDYDLDGDLDFAVLAFFSDYDTFHGEHFVFLENLDSENFHFESHTFEEAGLGRWLVMDKGDVDQDGDVDILLGSFVLPLEGNTTGKMEVQKNGQPHLLLLRNDLKN